MRLKKLLIFWDGESIQNIKYLKINFLNPLFLSLANLNFNDFYNKGFDNI